MARDFSSVKVKPVAAAVQFLERQIQNADPDIRNNGVTSVPKLKAPTQQIVDCAGRVFKSENWFARRTAANVLTRSVLHGRGPETASAATQLAGDHLDHEDGEVRRVAATALVQIAAQPPPDRPKSLPGEALKEAKPQDQEKIDALSIEAARQLSLKLSHKDPDVRENAVNGISRLDKWVDSHAEELCKRIGDEECFVRHAVIRAVDSLGALLGFVSEEMGAWLEHDDVAVRYAAKSCLLTLAKYDGKSAAKGAVKYLRSSNARTRLAALQVLLDLKNFSAPHAEAIASLLTDEDVSIRALVPRVLVAAAPGEEKKVSKCMKSVSKKMTHPNEDVARAAIDCMSALARVIDKFARSQGRLFLEDIPAENPETGVKQKVAAIQVLGNAGENAEPYLEEIISHMESKDWRIRRAVMHCMEDLREHAGDLGAKEVAKRLLHSEPDVRRCAAETIGRMGVHSGIYGQRVEAARETEEDEDVKAALDLAYTRLDACGILKADFGDEYSSTFGAFSPGPNP